MKFWLAQTINVDIPRTPISTAITNIINTLVFVAGALSVIFVLVGAFQYVISGGNPDATRRAKDTILYALIGVLVSGLGYAIVNYVLMKAG